MGMSSAEVSFYLTRPGSAEAVVSALRRFRDDLPAAQLPVLETAVVPLAELPGYLPADIPVVSAEQRREEIAARQAHIKRRWRAY